MTYGLIEARCAIRHRGIEMKCRVPILILNVRLVRVFEVRAVL